MKRTENDPLFTIFKKISKDEYIEVINSIQNIPNFFTFISNELVPDNEKVSVLENLLQILKKNRYISEFFSTYKSVRNQYNHVFDYYKNYINEKGLTELLTDEEIKGISRIDALDKTSRILQLLGLSDKVLPPQVYPLKHEIVNKINKEENATNKYGEGVTILEENDDAYLIFYPVVTDNIPSSNIFANGANEILDCSKVFFIYSNEGIIEIYVSGIMSETEVLKSSQIISPVKAVNILSDSYSDILTDTRISVSLIKLVSIQRKVFKENTTDFYTEPVWLLYGKFTDTNDSENKKSLNDTDAIAFVSAVTGEIIPVNSVGG